MTSYIVYSNRLKVALDSDDDIQWITVKGNHIPIKKGQEKGEAIKEFFEKKGKSSGGKSEKGSGGKKESGSSKSGAKKSEGGKSESKSSVKKVSKRTEFEMWDELERVMGEIKQFREDEEYYDSIWNNLDELAYRKGFSWETIEEVLVKNDVSPVAVEKIYDDMYAHAVKSDFDEGEINVFFGDDDVEESDKKEEKKSEKMKSKANKIKGSGEKIHFDDDFVAIYSPDGELERKGMWDYVKNEIDRDKFKWNENRGLYENEDGEILNVIKE